MSLLEKLVLNHILAVPVVAAALGGVIGNIDRLIAALLKFFSPAQIESAIDAADAKAKAEVEKVAGESGPVGHS